MKINLHTLKESFYTTLESIYEIREIKSLFEIVCESIFDLSRTDLLLTDEFETTTDKGLAFNDALVALKSKKPVQYILHSAPFYGRDFYVDESVLIPRQETEELIELIKNETKTKEPLILDVGTGSGIIPVTLGRELTCNDIYAIDISAKALEVAKTNAQFHGVPVNYMELDILNQALWTKIPDGLDIIVSNPPYVMNKEKQLMNQNVLGFEPHLALFVEDHDPLVFYISITELANQKLKIGGQLFFEINEQLGEETREVLNSRGFIKTKVIKDINGKDRFVSGVKS